MKKTIVFAFATFGLMMTGCSNDPSVDEVSVSAYQELDANAQSGETIILKSGFAVTKVGNQYSMGDVLLSEKQVKLLEEKGTIYSDETEEDAMNGVPMPMTSGLGGQHPSETSRAIGRAPEEAMIWSMVRYVIDPSLAFIQRYHLRDAIRNIENCTNVRFYNATGQPTVDSIYGFAYPYVNVKDNPESEYDSYSSVGRLGGKQDLVLGCNASYAAVLHELCHACGMYHEHSRPDRDNYVSIYPSNMRAGASQNFQKITGRYYTKGGFDYNSLMLYDSQKFSVENKPTITKKDGSLIPEKDCLSEKDRAWLNYFYIPFIARSDAYRELDEVVYDGNNKILSETEREEFQAYLNNGNPTPPEGGRIPNEH